MLLTEHSPDPKQPKQIFSFTFFCSYVVKKETNNVRTLNKLLSRWKGRKVGGNSNKMSVRIVNHLLLKTFK